LYCPPELPVRECVARESLTTSERDVGRGTGVGESEGRKSRWVKQSTRDMTLAEC
jgi:hypothetical protein